MAAQSGAFWPSILQIFQANDETLYWSAFWILGAILVATQAIILPVAVQMSIYSFCIIYIGAHMSLLQKEICPETGKKQMKSESVNRRDAMLFPFIGSAALLALYIAYKFFPPYWVNILLATYLSVFGWIAMGETFTDIVKKVSPAMWSATLFSVNKEFPTMIGRWLGRVQFEASMNSIVGYSIGFLIGGCWLATKHWALHNVLAIAFSIQAIRMVSVGTFKIAAILLCGLFVYDIFWVFGTDVMVTVAKSFDAPAKLIFPISHSPWKQSILGLGDIVLPGMFIGMVLRFDHELHDKESLGNNPVDIHQRFPKYYFLCNLFAYEAGLLLTAVVMLTTGHAQPALLYLVPCCLAALLIPAWRHGQLGEVLSYTEENPEEAGGQEAVDPKKTK